MVCVKVHAGILYKSAGSDTSCVIKCGIELSVFYIILQVVECVNGDALVIKTADGKFKKCFLASIKPPR